MCRHERISKQASHHVTRLDSDTLAELADALSNPDGASDNARSSSSYFVRSGSTGGGGARLRASIYDHTIGALSRRREGRGQGQGQGRLPKVLEDEATLRQPLLSALLEEEGLRDGEVDEGEEGWGEAVGEEGGDAKSGGASPQPPSAIRFAPSEQDPPPASSFSPGSTALAPSHSATVNHLNRARKDGKPPSAMRKLRERTRDTIRLITGNPVSQPLTGVSHSHFGERGSWHAEGHRLPSMLAYPLMKHEDRNTRRLEALN